LQVAGSYAPGLVVSQSSVYCYLIPESARRFHRVDAAPLLWFPLQAGRTRTIQQLEQAQYLEAE
jgi:hypothetical protein